MHYLNAFNRIKMYLLGTFLVLFSVNTFAQSTIELVETSDFSIGEILEIESIVLGENRKLNIYLPASYSNDSLQSYPVIYLLDGSADEDFVHISGIVQFGSFSWINMVPESIVVGIANVDRKRDFTSPTQNKQDQLDFPTTGKSKKFISFLEKELQPLIDSTYRTTTVKTIIGQSLGGLLASEILIKKPDLFDNYIIVSPSLWWNDEKLLTSEMAAYESDKAIYIAVGKEGEIMERTARELYDSLKLIQQENTELYFEFLEDKTHGDALHIAVYNAFEKIFNTETD